MLLSGQSRNKKQNFKFTNHDINQVFNSNNNKPEFDIVIDGSNLYHLLKSPRPELSNAYFKAFGQNYKVKNAKELEEKFDENAINQEIHRHFRILFAGFIKAQYVFGVSHYNNVSESQLDHKTNNSQMTNNLNNSMSVSQAQEQLHKNTSILRSQPVKICILSKNPKALEFLENYFTDIKNAFHNEYD